MTDEEYAKHRKTIKEWHKILKRINDTKSGKNPYKGGSDMPVTSVDEVRKFYKHKLFLDEKASLQLHIKSEIERRQHDPCSDYNEVNVYMIQELQKLLNIPIKCYSDLEYVTWLFNNGDLRTEEEIKELEEDEYNNWYLSSGEYERDCFNNKTLFGWGGFLIVFPIVLLKLWDSLLIFAIPIALLAGLTTSLIGMTIATHINIKKAINHNVPINHPRFQHDRTEMDIAKAGTIASIVHIGHKTKNSIKDFTNVDSWKELK